MILITGIMGHVGYRLALHFSLRGKKVIGCYNKNLDNLKKKQLIKNNILVIKNNLNSLRSLKKIVKKHKISTCIYCSGVTHENFAKKDPEKTIKSNCLGIQNLLEIQKNRLIKKIIYISTGSVFQNIISTRNKIDENIIPTPKSLYSSTKRLGEILVNSYRDYFNCNATIIRISWVYGPPIVVKKFDPQRGPIPFIINKTINSKKKILKFNGGDFNASFTYVEDVCRFINFISKKKNFKNIYHLGSGKNYSNFELGKIIEKITEKKIIFSKGVMPWTNDSVIRGPLITKHKSKFKIKYNLEVGIKEYINWLRDEKK